jgi:fumarate reductase subunit D
MNRAQAHISTKRSNAPVFWLLFGAGGMLSALLGTALVFITGIAAPLGWPFGPNLLGYSRVMAFLQHWFGKGLLFAVIALFAWHAVHRIYHSLHDLGIPTGAVAKIVCYGGALLITVVAAASLLSIGF